ncbi:MAG: zf-HC2 domain-containing protein [Candidatus Tumulicola sp.]
MNHAHPTVDQLIDYAHGELSSHEGDAVRAHLAACPACIEAHDAQIRLGELLRQHARSEELELPPGLVTSIYARAASEPPAPAWWTPLASALRPALAVPIAAAVALAIYFASAGWHTNVRTDATDAAYYMENHAALATTVPFEGDAVPTVLTSDQAAP